MRKPSLEHTCQTVEAPHVIPATERTCREGEEIGSYNRAVSAFLFDLSLAERLGHVNNCDDKIIPLGPDPMPPAFYGHRSLHVGLGCLRHKSLARVIQCCSLTARCHVTTSGPRRKIRFKALRGKLSQVVSRKGVWHCLQLSGIPQATTEARRAGYPQDPAPLFPVLFVGSAAICFLSGAQLQPRMFA